MKVKLMTLNINHGGELIENICDFIEAEQPDILLIQEAYNGINPKLEQRFRSMDILARSMNATQTFFTSAYMDGDVDIDRGNGIISKFPIIASEGTIFNSAYRTIHNESNLGDWSDQPRVIQVCEIAVEGKHINIANVQGSVRKFLRENWSVIFVWIALFLFFSSIMYGLERTVFGKKKGNHEEFGDAR
jgi:endonuclease/exonuclease/phosphatase family metal-dependent hydrolase